VGVVETKDVPYVVNLLTVAISHSGKERLVLDLRHVNRYIEKQKVKFEGVIILSLIGVLRIPEEFYLYKDKDKSDHM
jgi:hypothetical protein